MLYKSFDEIELEYVKSYTNFAFFKQVSTSIFQQTLLDRGILVGRPFPPYYDWCRISTGKIEDVRRFTNELKRYYS